MKRTNLSSGAKWEEIVGYSRGVSFGNHIEITGTVATSKGEILYKGDPYHQTKYVLEKIEKCIVKLGGKLEDIIRTRIYVTDINNWAEIGRAHAEFFNKIYPATTMVEVSQLIHKDYLVEIEASAFKGVSEVQQITYSE